jgi:hypothetical protein
VPARSLSNARPHHTFLEYRLRMRRDPPLGESPAHVHKIAQIVRTLRACPGMLLKR